MGKTSNRQGYVSVMQSNFYSFNDMCLELFYAQTGNINIRFTIKKIREDLQTETLFDVKGGVPEKIDLTKILMEGTEFFSSFASLQSSSNDNTSSEGSSSQIDSGSAPGSETTNGSSYGDSGPINGSNTGDSEPTSNMNSAEPSSDQHNPIFEFHLWNTNEKSNENIAPPDRAVEWKRIHTHLPDGVYQIKIEGLRPNDLDKTSGMVVDDISIWPCEKFRK